MKLSTIAQSDAAQQAKLRLVPHSPRFGYEALDRYYPGLLPGQLTVVAGGTSMGKTTFLANCAYNMAYKQQKHTIFASLESGDTVSQPIMQLSGGMSSDYLHILTSDTQVTIESLESMITNNIELCEILIIDHIHYLAQDASHSMSATIAKLTRDIQMMAVKLNIPIIVVAHVRKLKSETDIPSMNDLKDSSALFQDPSNVIIVHRHKNESTILAQSLDSDEPLPKFSNMGLLVLEKNRDFGRTGALPLEFNPKTLQFAVGGEWIINGI